MDAPRALVLRVESLFGSPAGWTGRRGTVDAIVDGIRAGREVPVLTDRVVSPSYSPDVAAATRHLVDRGGALRRVSLRERRPRHLGDRGPRDRAAAWRRAPNLKRLTTDQLTLRAARPRYCALATPKLAAQGFRSMPRVAETRSAPVSARI